VQSVDISSALPFLPGLKPGDTVYLLDGFTESVECPGCGGSGQRTRIIVTEGYAEPEPCRPCNSVGRLSCPFPVDAPDHPCVQP